MQFIKQNSDGSFNTPQHINGQSINNEGVLNGDGPGMGFPRNQMYTPTEFIENWLNERGWYRYETDETPSLEWYESPETSYEKVGNIVRRRFNKTYKDVETVRQGKLQELQASLNAAKSVGIPFMGEVLQTRPKDTTNLQAIKTQAASLVAQGNPSTLIEVRVESNRIVEGRADSVLSVLLSLDARLEALRKQFWTHKDAINALTEVDKIVAYDTTIEV